MSLKDKYAIAGIGYTSQGIVPQRSSLRFHLEACANAISDAGLRKEDVDDLICYRHFPPFIGETGVPPYLVARQLGIAPAYLAQDASCSRNQLLCAVGALEAGLCRNVLISYR